MLNYVLKGLASLGTVDALAYLFAGSLIGTFVGVIPGLSGAVVLSIMLAFVYHVNLIGMLCLFLGAHAGSYYSASITSILLNTPAHPEAYAVTLDGYPMARRGQAARALGISAASTCFGGFVGCLVLLAAIPIMDLMPQLFHPPEYLAVITIAMLLVGTLGTDSLAKAVASMGIGFVIASMGPSNITGVMRFNFGLVDLLGGISVVALSMALFAIPQMVMVYGTKTNVAKQDMSGNEVEIAEEIELRSASLRQVLGGVAESARHWLANIQAGLVGAFAGIIPGMGGFTANFMSYGVARQFSRKRDRFGTGIPEGIIAPEGSSLAKEAGHMIPLLGLAIPGGVGGALFIAALTIQGVRPGFGFTTEYPLLSYQVVWILALSGLIGTVAGVVAGPQLAKVTKIPGPILVPFLFAMSVVGPFLADVAFLPVIEVLVFGIVGLVLRRLKFSVATLVLGLVLGPTFESNIYLIHNVYRGAEFLRKQPIADTLFGIAILVLIVKALEERRTRRKRLAAHQQNLADIKDPVRRAEAARLRRAPSPHPVLELLTTVALIGVGIFWTWYSIAEYDLPTGLFATVAGLLVFVPMLFRLPFDVRGFWYHRRRTAAARQQPVADRAAVPGPLLARPVGEGTAGLRRDGRSAGGGAAAGDVAVEERVSPAMPSAGSPAPQPVTAASAASTVVDRSWGRNGQYRRELVALAWFAGLVGACYLVGFLWAIPAFMFAYGMTSCSDYLRTRRGRLVFSVLSAAGMWFVSWLMIDQVLHLPFTPLIQL